MFDYRIPWARATLAALCFASLSGFTECDHFQEVTVPSSDNSTPGWFHGVMKNGQWVETGVNTDFEYELIGLHETVSAIGSGLDSGGVKEMNVQWEERVMCCNQRGLCENRLINNEETYVDTQSGGPGSKVSNGIWGGRTFDPQEVLQRECKPWYRTYQSRLLLRWRVETWDFHNNFSQSPWSSISYRWP